jgi:hypothetical protein
MLSKLIIALEKAFCKLRRKRISMQIFKKFKGVIQYGPFEGMILTSDTNTSTGMLGSKILGFYEDVVTDFIFKNGPYDNCINLGSADGYFAIGLLMKKLTKKSICFEISSTGRESIIRNATVNNCEDSITIFGEADKLFFEKVNSTISRDEKNLIICDIEGGEFDILNNKTFENFTNCTWVIEIHDRIQDLSLTNREELIKNIPENYSYEILKSQPICWPEIEILEDLSDNDRALLFSEGRRKIGEWLVIKPNAQ